jgi:hypothetical protein
MANQNDRTNKQDQRGDSARQNQGGGQNTQNQNKQSDDRGDHSQAESAVAEESPKRGSGRGQQRGDR